MNSYVIDWWTLFRLKSCSLWTLYLAYELFTSLAYELSLYSGQIKNMNSLGHYSLANEPLYPGEMKLINYDAIAYTQA